MPLLNVRRGRIPGCASKKENQGKFTWKKEDDEKEKEAQRGVVGCVKISGLKS